MRIVLFALLALLPALGCPSPDVRPTPPPAEPDGGPGPEVAPPPEVRPGPLASLLTVEIRGFRSDAGLVRVSLFAAPEGFPEDPARARRIFVGPIQGGRCLVEWPGLEPGTYAVAAIHDADADGHLGRGLFGIPSEGFGVSNDPPVRLGLPRFEDATFRLEPPGRALILSMRYF
jgi:uncharacterized protein (DUF2141 family)